MVSVEELEAMATELRKDSLRSTTAAGSGHPTTCMSCADIMSALFFSELGEIDEFVLSKGHAAPILWSAYAHAGIIKHEQLATLRKIDSPLEGHPTPRIPMVKVATGSLGQGLCAGVGMALAQKLEKKDARTFVLLGDGECAEGSVWEAANTAHHYKLDNLVAVVDVNRLGQSQPAMHEHNMDEYAQKFAAFGWDAHVFDGHDMKAVLAALEHARNSDKPCALIAQTFKGAGVSFLSDKDGWHGKALPDDKLQEALAELGEVSVPALECRMKPYPAQFAKVTFTPNTYELGEKIATRQAFGNAVLALGKLNESVVAVDADVRNSTMLKDFFNAYPKRGFQSFIAEQNMVGMALGFSTRGFIPFVSTFAAFLTRAHDFIRMALYSEANVKIAGSHVGVSIGQDGASQMGLEDISMMLSIPHALVLYPSDAVSTEYLTGEMAQHTGISYMRTTRGKTPVIYDNNETFPIGGLKVVRESENDSVLVVGAGETLHEALAAHEELQKEGVHIRVIDLYSLQPCDHEALRTNAAAANNRVIVVEDHYANGMGSVVREAVGHIHHLYVKDIPRSGGPEELRALFGIDKNAIITAVRETLK